MAKQKVLAVSATKVPAGFNGFEFKCKGRFITKPDMDTGKRSVVTFAESVLVPANALSIFDEVATRHEGTNEDGTAKTKTTEFRNYLGKLKKKMLPMKLSARDGNFAAVREFHVEEVIGHGGADVVDLGLPLKLMSLAQLKQYCQFHSISKGDIDPSSYLEVEELREDLWNYQEDKVAYLARASSTKKTREAERAFLDLNSVIADANGVGESTSAPASGGRSGGLVKAPTDDVL